MVSLQMHYSVTVHGISVGEERQLNSNIWVWGKTPHTFLPEHHGLQESKSTLTKRHLWQPRVEGATFSLLEVPDSMKHI